MATVKGLLKEEQALKSYLPMSEASFLLLDSLRNENHGYGIMQQVNYLTQGRVKLGAGTVYTILYKMENDGLIKAVREMDRRKVYLITTLGTIVLQTEAQRLLQMAQVAQNVLEEQKVTC